MAAGGFSVSDAGTDYSVFSASRIQWCEGRGGSLLGFAPDGRLVAYIVRGRHIAQREDAWLRLALGILRVTPLADRFKRAERRARRAVAL